MTTQAEVVALTQYPIQETLMRPIATPKELMSYHEDMTCIIREALKDGRDYGVIPGTKKPTLFKPGAERINIAFGTHPEYDLVEKEIAKVKSNRVPPDTSTKTPEELELEKFAQECANCIKVKKSGFEFLFLTKGSMFIEVVQYGRSIVCLFRIST